MVRSVKGETYLKDKKKTFYIALHISPPSNSPLIINFRIRIAFEIVHIFSE